MQSEVAANGAATYSSAIQDASNYTNWLAALCVPHLQSPVLEVGIGHGSYAKLLAREGEYLGVDIDEDCVRNAALAIPELTFRVSDISMDDAVASLGVEKWGSVVTMNVLEHIEDDGAAFARLVKMLRPGGRLVVIVPAMQALYNDLDRLAGHYRRYRLSDFERLESDCSLRRISIGYINPIGGLGWWANRFSRRDSLDDEGFNRQIRIFDRYVAPVSKAMSPLTRKFFGQSVCYVGEKT